MPLAGEALSVTTAGRKCGEKKRPVQSEYSVWEQRYVLSRPVLDFSFFFSPDASTIRHGVDPISTTGINILIDLCTTSGQNRARGSDTVNTADGFRYY